MFLGSSSSLFLFSCGACWKVEVWKVKVKVRQVGAGTFLFDFSVFVDNMRTAPEVLVFEDVPMQVTCK